MAETLILIPPSEGKVPLGQGKSLKSLSDEAQEMYDRLMRYQGNRAVLYGVKGKALQAACMANENLLRAPTMPAINRYSGVVYDGLDYSSLSPKAKEFCNRHVRIVSALYGLLSPQDLIADYKLKIEKLDAAAYWKPILKHKLTQSYVIDLLPQAHLKAVEYGQGIRVDFIFLKNGRSAAAGHAGKLIKGQFVRWLCEHQVVGPQRFSGFAHDGFRFDGKNFIKDLSIT